MKMRKQRIMGAVLVLLSILILFWAATGESPELQDGTIVLLILPLGLYMMFTKHYILYP